MNSQQTILKKISSQKEALRAFGIVRIGLFGSFIRGEATKKSDIDLLIEFDPAKKTYRNLMGTADYMEELTGKSVDIITPQSISPHLKPHILKEVKYVEIAR